MDKPLPRAIEALLSRQFQNILSKSTKLKNGFNKGEKLNGGVEEDLSILGTLNMETCWIEADNIIL